MEVSHVVLSMLQSISLHYSALDVSATKAGAEREDLPITKSSRHSVSRIEETRKVKINVWVLDQKVSFACRS